MQHVGGVVAFGDQSVKRVLHGPVQVGAAHGPTVHKPVLVSARFAGMFGPKNEAVDFHHVRLFRHGHHAFVGFLAQYVQETGTVVFRFQMEFFPAVVFQGKGYMRMGQRQPHKGVQDGLPLYGVGFQKLPARGHVEK